MTGPVRQSKRIRNESVEEQPSKMSKSNKDSQPVRINALGITNESIDDHLENIQASLDDQTNVQEEFIEVQSEPAQYMEQEEIQVFDDNKAKDTEAQFNNVTIEDAQPSNMTIQPGDIEPDEVISKPNEVHDSSRSIDTGSDNMANRSANDFEAEHQQQVESTESMNEQQQKEPDGTASESASGSQRQYEAFIHPMDSGFTPHESNEIASEEPLEQVFTEPVSNANSDIKSPYEFSETASLEAKRARSEWLKDSGTFFTREAYVAYSIPQGFTPEQREILKMAQKYRIEFEKSQRMERVQEEQSQPAENELNEPVVNETRCSAYTRQDHAHFISLSEKINAGIAVSEEEDRWHREMSSKFRAEQIEYINEQREKMNESGAYDLLDERVNKIIQEHYHLEKQRVYKYPRYYKYYNQFIIPPIDMTTEKPILSFKKTLMKTGQITWCKPDEFTLPVEIDLSKNYFFSNHDTQEDAHYKKKIPPTISNDEAAHSLLENVKMDVVISTSCLLNLVEMHNDPSVSSYIPLMVKQDGKTKTVYFDRPLPKDVSTARERNKLVYDVAFKSLCLDWSKRHAISSSSKQHASTPEWDYNNDENLQYNHWTFGDLNLLIRNQSDGDVFNVADKKASLVSKLEYQITEGREESTTGAERAMNWLRSYIGGHSMLIEGRIDVVKNRLIRIVKKQMLDIMGDHWRPIEESEMLRHTFSHLHRTLEPGNYLLYRRAEEKNFLLYSSVDELPKQNSAEIIDLQEKYKMNQPFLGHPKNSFVPAIKEQKGQV
ncbi:hypothetical protein G6F33_008120 [Rhizopus arrhizus]|nr:hypothetical protein G6F33_008120 [Rhizopus arrhizus]